MTETVLDYTRARLGSGKRNRKIERCPECGRKGQMLRMLNPRSGGKPQPPRWICTHVEHLRNVHGMRFSSGRDVCTGRIIDGECRTRTAA